METARLDRKDMGDQGSFGVIAVPRFWCYSGELPWLDNAPSTSCIPEGAYSCEWTYSPRFRRFMYLVGDVLNRTGIRKHPANLMGNAALGFKAQLNGCISLGERLGWIDRQKALLLSVPAIRRFEARMEHKPFILEIRNAG